MIRLYHHIIHSDLEKPYCKMSEKIKTINRKVEQNKGQNNLDRQIAKISALSLGNVNEYECFTRRMFYQKHIC